MSAYFAIPYWSPLMYGFAGGLLLIRRHKQPRSLSVRLLRRRTADWLGQVLTQPLEKMKGDFAQPFDTRLSSFKAFAVRKEGSNSWRVSSDNAVVTRFKFKKRRVRPVLPATVSSGSERKKCGSSVCKILVRGFETRRSHARLAERNRERAACGKEHFATKRWHFS